MGKKNLSQSLPSSEETEKAIIGAIMINHDLMDDAVDVLHEEDFFHPTYRLIFRSMLKLYNKSKPVDPLTVAEELKKHTNLDSLGGVSALMRMTIGVPSYTILEPIQIVKNKSKLRKLIHASNDIIQECLEEQDDAEDIYQRAEQKVYELSDEGTSTGMESVIQLIDTSIQNVHQIQDTGEEITGLTYGFADIDHRTLGMQKQELIILAARPSVGKSAMGFGVGQTVAYIDDKVVAGFSLEMSKEQLAHRMICSEARVDNRKYRSGSVTEEEWERINIARDMQANSRFFIDDMAGVNASYIRGKLRRLRKQEGQLDLVIVDYLQLMSATQKNLPREQEVSSISRDLKSIAKEFNVPVLALSQLSRKPESRGDHRPTLGDLRESGAIEQDADVVMFIYRHDMYVKDEMEKTGIAEIIIAKNRQGPIDTIELKYEDKYTKFVNILEDAQF